MKKQLQTIFSTRQHMLSKNFEIYYYDVAHFSGISNHTHNYYEFYFFLNGNVSMFIDGIPFKLQTGDVIMIPPNVPHHAVATGKAVPYISGTSISQVFSQYGFKDYFCFFRAFKKEYGLSPKEYKELNAHKLKKRNKKKVLHKKCHVCVSFITYMAFSEFFYQNCTIFCSNYYCDMHRKKLLLPQTILEVDNLVLCPPLGIPLLLKSVPHDFHEKRPIRWSNDPFPE